MKYAYWSLGLIMFGMFGIVAVVMFESITVNNETEYYSLKEAMEASMIESVDLAYYRLNGNLKISEQKFVENFTKRFANNVAGDVKDYEIQFYDIMELPPKATVVITGTTKDYTLSTEDKDISFDIKNNLTGILEFNNVG